MRIAVVGPVHPYKGGVAQHTASLAQHLADLGHEVVVESWLRQYPRMLYPGQLTVDVPETKLSAPVSRELAWNNPLSCRRVGKRLSRFDRVIIAHASTVQVPVYRSLLRRLRTSPAVTTVICHNVLPHEHRPFDKTLVRALLTSPDRVLVHSQAQADVAAMYTQRPVAVATMAPFFPAAFQRRTPSSGVHHRLLFFGIVRPYKGLDVLLRALARGPEDVELRVVGEFWGGSGATKELVAGLGLAGRVEFREGYVPAHEVNELFADVDALVLPYRAGTGSQNVWLGFEFGVPVITTSAGRLAEDVRPGIDGLVVRPDDVDALVIALNDFYQPGVPLGLREAVMPVDPEPFWHRYIDALLGSEPTAV